MKRHSRTGFTLFQLLIVLAGEVQRVNARLADAEERLAFAGPAVVSGPLA